MNIIVFLVEFPIETFPKLRPGYHTAIQHLNVFNNHDFAQLCDIGRSDQSRKWIWQEAKHKLLWTKNKKNHHLM